MIENGLIFCRPEADVGADLKAAIATAVQPGNWHRPNPQDEEETEDFTQSAYATVAIWSIRINKRTLQRCLRGRIR